MTMMITIMVMPSTDPAKDRTQGSISLIQENQQMFLRESHKDRGGAYLLEGS